MKTNIFIEGNILVKKTLFMRYLSLFIIFVLCFSNFFSYNLFVQASSFYISLQKVSTDTTSAFTNQQDNLGVSPGQEFRFESYVRNETGNQLTNITYNSSFPTGIVYNTTTTAASQNNIQSASVIPTSAFNPPSVPVYQDTTSLFDNATTYKMRRILLKFPANWPTYENILSNYFTATGGITSDTKTTTIWVNVRPHIIDYYFEKTNGGQTTNQVQGSNGEPINLVVKVKDYNGCSNVSGGSVKANLSSLGLSATESLTFVSCDSDSITATFKKTGITTSSTIGDYAFDPSKFTATDSDGNMNTISDTNTAFSNEDKKTNMTLTVVPNLTPVVNLVSLSDNLIGGPEKLTSTLIVSSTSSGTIKAVIGGDSSCASGTIINDWTSYTENTNKSFSISSSLLSEGNNNISVCLAKNSYTGSLIQSITKDTTPPVTSVPNYTVNVALNDSHALFNCSEDGYFAGEIGGNGTYGSGTGSTSWAQATSGIQNTFTILNSYLNIGSNPFYVYCKDKATNISYNTGTVVKTVPVLSMSGLVTSFHDNDIDFNGLDGRDISISWQKPVGDISNFYSYQLYVFPSNVDFNSGTYGNNYIKYIDNSDITSFTGTANIINDSTNNPLVSGGSYKACVVIRGKDLSYGTVGCSSPAVLTADIVQNPKVLSAKFTSNTNLELTTDAPLDTNLSSHTGAFITYNYNGTTFSGSSIGSVNGSKINLTIPALNSLSASGSNILMLTGAIHSASGGYNNYFSSGGLSITDGQAPSVTGFINNTTSSYNSFYNTGINVGFTFAETMKPSGYTYIAFDRVSGNASSQKISYITDSTKLTSGSKNQDLTLSGFLVSGTTYNMYLVGQDLAGNSVTSSGLSVKFDNVGPTKVSIIDAPSTASQTPAISWNSTTDDSGNGSGIRDYTLKIYPSSDCSLTAVQTLTGTTTSKATNTLSNGTYSWNVFATDNMGNAGTISDCDSFIVDTTIATISNLKITDTTLNSTSYAKTGDTISITANLTNTNSSKITADLSALTGNSSHIGVICASPSSGIGCTYTSGVVTYTFALGFSGSVTQSVRQITLNVSNSGGTQSTSGVSSITVDSTAPTVGTITSPVGTIGGNSNNIVWSGISDTNLDYLKFEYSSNAGSSYTLIGTGGNSSPRAWDTSSLTSGSNYKIKITAYDRALNQSSTESSSFTIDKDGPTISAGVFTSVSSGAYIKGNSSYNITWDSSKVTDAGGLSGTPIQLYYSTDSTNWNLIGNSLANNGSYSWSVPGVNSSNVKLKMIATDNVGNATNYIIPYSLIVDSTLPTFSIGISTPANGKYINNNGFKIEGVATDTYLKSISYSLKRVGDSYYWNGSSYSQNSTWNILQDNISGISYNTNTLITPTISNGESYDLTIKATDYAGNEFQTVTRRYLGDVVLPNISITTSSGSYFQNSITISGTSSDSGSSISSVKISIKKGSSFWDGSNWIGVDTKLSTTTSNSYANWNYSFNPPGTDSDGQSYEVIVYAYDSSYDVNNSSSVSIGVKIDTSSPVISDPLFSIDTGKLYLGGDNLAILWNNSLITDTGAGLKSNPIGLEYFDGTSNWITITNNLPNNGSYNFTLPTLDSSNIKIRLSATDNVGNISYKISNSFTVDSTPPTIVSVETMDLGASGKIDALKVNMSESIKDSSITLSNFNISSGIGVPTGFITGNQADDNSFILTFSSTGSTSLTPTISYTKGTLTDLAGKYLENVSSVISVDKAVPRIISASSYDNNFNGKLDSVEVTFSENISSTNNLGAFSINSKNILGVSVSGNKATLAIDEGASYDTSASLSLDFTSNSNWKDLVGNQAGSLGTSLTIQDKAPPILYNYIIKDSNSDYIPNTIELTFSESLTGSLSGFSISTGTILSRTLQGGNKVVLSVSNISGTSPSVSLSYSGNIADLSGNNLSSISNLGIVDKISPKLISAYTLDRDGNGKLDSVILNFGENLTGTFSDFIVNVSGYSLASSNVYSLSGSQSVIVSLQENGTFDGNAKPSVNIVSNTSLKDNSGNQVLGSQSIQANDGIGPIIIGARFDEGTKNLYMTFSENVSGNLNNSNFVLGSASAGINSVTFSSGSSSATVNLTNTGITYGSSQISFAGNSVGDIYGNKQLNTYFVKISASVIINEYLSVGDVKYIELKNISSSTVNIGGWILSNASAGDITLNSYSIPANSYFLISNNNTYFSGVVSDQTSPLNITGNILLKNGNVLIDSAINLSGVNNNSIERLANCENSLSSSCWYNGVVSKGFVNSSYKGTPKSGNIFDGTIPSITYFSPNIDKIFPFTKNINASFNYQDNIGGVGIDTGSLSVSLQKFNGSTWGNVGGLNISTGSINSSGSTFNIGGLNSYGKYKLDFGVSDLVGNTVNQSIIFYIDDFSMTLSGANINLGVLTPGDLKLMDNLVNVQIKTIGASFNVINQTETPSNFANWNGSLGYGGCLGTSCSSLSNFSDYQLVTQTGELQSSGSLKTYNYEIKYGALINSLQEAGLYNFLNKNKVNVTY